MTLKGEIPVNFLSQKFITKYGKFSIYSVTFVSENFDMSPVLRIQQMMGIVPSKDSPCSIILRPFYLSPNIACITLLNAGQGPSADIDRKSSRKRLEQGF